MSTPTTTTEAYIARPDNSITLEPITYAPLSSHELLVEIISASLCYTDIKAAAGQFRLAPPLILGHEGAGYVIATGSQVSDVEVGDAVVLGYASCGKCRRCVMGRAAYCDFLGEMNFGGRRANGENPVRDQQGEEVNGLFFGQSSLGRIALVNERCAVRVGGEVGREELRLFAALGCGVQTGAGAILNVARPPPSSQIAIFGAGAVGLSAVLAIKLSSPTSSVYLIDNSSAKIASLTANNPSILENVTTIDSSTHGPDALVPHIKSLTPAGRGVDIALDCVGSEAVTSTCHSILDKCGLLLNIGSSATAKAGFLLSEQLVRGIIVRGTHQGDSVSRIMIPYLIEQWRKGLFPFDRLLTEYKFEDLAKAMENVKAGKVIKALLVM